MVISCLFTYSTQRGGGTHALPGPQLCSQPEVGEASAATVVVRGRHLLVQKGKRTGRIAEVRDLGWMESGAAAGPPLRSCTLICSLSKNNIASQTGGSQSPRVTSCQRFRLRPPQIIKDRVFSHVSRNKYMWNSLPGGLLVLPEYSTHLAHFPFYYLGLGKHPRDGGGGGVKVQAVVRSSARTSSA